MGKAKSEYRYNCLHLAPYRVQMDKAEKGDDRMATYINLDSISHFIRFNDYWGYWSQLEGHGDPTVASAEKSEIIFTAVVEGLVDLVDALREWPIEERANMHEQSVQNDIHW